MAKVSPLLSSPLLPCNLLNKLLSPLFSLGEFFHCRHRQPPHNLDAPHLLACVGNLLAGTLPRFSRNFLGLSLCGPTLVLLGKLMTSSRGYFLVRIQTGWGSAGGGVALDCSCPRPFSLQPFRGLTLVLPDN